MMPESSSIPAHRSAQAASSSVSEAGESAQRLEGIEAWLAEQSRQTYANNTTTAHAWDPYPEDFDAERQYWPSSTHNSTGLDSTEPLVSRFSDFAADRDAATATALARHQGQYVNPFREERHAIRSVPLAHPNAGSSSRRVDILARNTLREMIVSAVLLDSLSPPERVALLDAYRAEAESSKLGIPFREILSEPMEPLGITPLMYEIMGCTPEWEIIDAGIPDFGLEMVTYLITQWSDNFTKYGRMGVLENVIRAACLRRLDDDYEGNKLFHYLRARTFEVQLDEGENCQFFDYDVSIAPSCGANIRNASTNPSDLDFTALISVPQFATRLALAQSQISAAFNEAAHSTGRKAPATVAPTFVPVEFMAAKRAWCLKLDSNSLRLELLDGPGGSTTCIVGEDSSLMTDARVKIISPECEQQLPASGQLPMDLRIGSPVELLLPRRLLSPAAAPETGASETTLSPCFCAAPGELNGIRGLDDTRLLHDGRGALLLELTVHFVHTPPPGFAFVDTRDTDMSQNVDATPVAGPSGIADAHMREFEDEDDLYITSEIEEKMGDLSVNPKHEESEWEELSQADETEAMHGGWVKASWSGKDEEL
ncbi:uncharacterized protein FOMMEDRAFT_148872 [Fomitiporia mediterranea MF3/22]|uniref:uncharacterized protein n=1 Tax=Fomitiporia mediterranea (strain MF3/22) TaxID=694068 RepID=UPI0004407D73|nr:uncharacterized protein FOMMEDRAFT_148872 [Fomitiporia mediterranea MF3/22]EJC98854.1 hypothetical protein FOMMEDRAFT_148872 [Fomitiporia mediterranea MF3/22]